MLDTFLLCVQVYNKNQMYNNNNNN